MRTAPIETGYSPLTTSTPPQERSHAATPAHGDVRSGRLLSLDVFRGATIAAMVLVNDPGEWTTTYAPLLHARWNGWTFTDIIAPTFLWIVGVAIALTMPRPGTPLSVARPLRHVVRRTAILFGLGIFIAAIPWAISLFDPNALATLRIPGTLQRIAVCYLCASLIVRQTGPRGQLAWALWLIAAYTVTLLVIPVPGIGAGVLTPTGNFPQWLDRVVLGAHTKASDPLGILGTLPSISTTLFGVLAGQLLRRDAPPETKAAELLVMGSVMLAVGEMMSGGVPVNKSLWTPSFTVLMAGISTSAFAVCYWLLDVRGYTRWSRPFAIFGLNGLVMFILSSVLSGLLTAKGISTPTHDWISIKGYVFETFFRPLGDPAMASLCYAIVWTLGFFLLAYVMYRRNWIVKV